MSDGGFCHYCKRTLNMCECPDEPTEVERLRATIDAQAQEIATLKEQLGITRMCVNCGKFADAATVQPGDDLPECVGPEGFAACTFDMTPREAVDFWRQHCHDTQAELTRLRAECE